MISSNRQFELYNIGHEALNISAFASELSGLYKYLFC